jgi:hypothetical protein
LYHIPSLASKALHRCYIFSIPSSGVHRTTGQIGLKNPASCEPVRVRGDQVLGERFCATTDGITSADDSFPDEDFFLDISSLDIDDMTDDANANANLNANANANLNANVNPPVAPYAMCSYLF